MNRILPKAPVAPCPPRIALTRRQMLALAGAGAAGFATGLPSGLLAQAVGAQAGFTHGVASGEPGPDRVLLWTRFAAHQNSPIEWELSESLDFARIVAQGGAVASPQNDGCVKVWASGLVPDRWYYFRFRGPGGARSITGRTRTLPEGSVAGWKMAVFSCANFAFGHFNAYGHAAAAADADLALHLGDYIYEYGRGTYPASHEAAPGRLLWPEGETLALADYRLRHATYRQDPDLRRLHQIVPMICVWDDHETANDAWMGGAENHDPASEGDWAVRKAAALRAYREWMPVSDAPYAHYQIGDLATLFRLETRLEGRERQFDLGSLLKGHRSPEETIAALTAFREGQWADPARQLLGKAQEGWLFGGLRDSVKAGARWQVLVQQVVMGELSTPPALLDALSTSAPDYARGAIAAAAMAARAGLPANMDAWDGYPAARARLLRASQQAGANLLVLAGDSHNGWAFELEGEGERAGVELAVQSVTSPGLEAYLGALAPQELARELVRHNRQLHYADTARRGYLQLELTHHAARAEYRFLDTIRTRDQRLAGVHRLSSPAGSGRFEPA